MSKDTEPMVTPTRVAGESPGGSARPEPSAMTRKRFLWTLGAGTMAIAGYCLIPPCGAASADDDTGSTDGSTGAEPWLRDDVVTSADGEGLVLTRPTRASSPVCAVNGAGAVVIRRLDGRTSVPAIARVLAEQAHTSAVGEVEVKVACFVAQLGELGFLRAPFCAMITERFDE